MLCAFLAVVVGTSWAQVPMSAEPGEWGVGDTVLAALFGGIAGANLPMLAYISAAGFMAFPARMIGAVLGPLMLGEITRRFWLASSSPALGIVADVIIVAATAADFLLIRRWVRRAEQAQRRARGCTCGCGEEQPGPRAGGCGESPR